MFFQPLIPVLILTSFTFVIIVVQFFRTKSRSQRTRWVVRGVAVLLVLFAALRPSVASLAAGEVYNNRYDVYFVVDLTSSMVAEDWDGDESTRLDGVREDINDLLDDYVGAKFSLLTFNSATNLRVPLTPDSTAIASAANTMLPEVTAYSKGSSISEPVETLTQLLAEEESDRAKIVLYFGDGEQTNGEEPDSFEPAAENIDQARVYGYGTEEGGRMKTQTGYYIAGKEDEYIKSSDGQEGVSVIDETNLEAIASQLKGEYEHRSPDTRIKAADLDEGQKLDLQEKDGSTINNTDEFYWVFLIPVALLMFIEGAALFKAARALGVKRK
jgi:Ca-activated chloride channel family protein